MRRKRRIGRGLSVARPPQRARVREWHPVPGMPPSEARPVSSATAVASASFASDTPSRACRRVRRGLSVARASSEPRTQLRGRPTCQVPPASRPPFRIWKDPGWHRGLFQPAEGEHPKGMSTSQCQPASTRVYDAVHTRPKRPEETQAKSEPRAEASGQLAIAAKLRARRPADRPSPPAPLPLRRARGAQLARRSQSGDWRSRNPILGNDDSWQLI